MFTTRNILICDDDAFILEMVEQLLTGAGYSVSTARGHQEFMEKLCDTKPDLILLDVHMPDCDGFSIAQRVARSQIPIIFMTAHDRPSYRQCAPIVGAEDYIAKPFDTDFLLSRIQTVLDTQKKATSLLAKVKHAARSEC